MKPSNPEDVLLPVQAAGLKLRNPFIVGSGPTAKTVEQLVQAEACGWAAASIKLAMDPPPYVNLPPRYRWLRKERYHVFTAETRLTLDQGLRLMEEGRQRTREIALFANFAYTGEDGAEGWVRMAHAFQNTGAHALELNLCCPNMSFNVEHSSESVACPASGASLGTDPVAVAEITRAVKTAARIPVFAKISPEAGNIADVAAAAFAAGADAVTSAGNRLGIPPFDLADPARSFYRAQRGMSLGCLSGSLIKPLAQREVFEIRRRVGPGPCIVGMGGVTGPDDAIRFAMCGADLIGICTHTMLHGFGFLPPLIRRVRDFLSAQRMTAWSDLTGALLPHMLPANELYVVPAFAEIDETLCTECGRCVEIGHCSAIEMKKGRKAQVDPARCTACSTCIDVCPAGALRMIEKGNHEDASET